MPEIVHMNPDEPDEAERAAKRIAAIYEDMAIHDALWRAMKACVKPGNIVYLPVGSHCEALGGTTILVTLR